MQSVDLIISAKWIYPVIPRNLLLEDHSLVINQNKIIDLIPTAQVKNQYQAKQHYDLKTKLLMPGLINTHTHMTMNLYRGLADDLALMEWLNDHIWPAEAKYTNPQTVALGAKLAMAEMIRGGTTCFNDMYFYPDVMAQSILECKMRGTIGITIMQVNNGWSNGEKDALEKAKAAYENRPATDLISWAFAPHAPYTNSDASLLAIRDYCAAHDIPMHMHLHETQAEIDIDNDNYRLRPIARLEKLKLFNSRFVAFHMVHLTPEEIALMAQHQVNVVHCPESNLKLASGFAPIKQLLDVGINVSLGTDGAASNNDLDMFGELRTATFIAKALSKDPTALPAHQVLEMATINGAKALGLAQQIGSLEIGKLADVIAIEFDHLFTQPVYHPISHLAYAVNRLQVSHVWVNGDCLLDDYQFTQLDVDGLLKEAQPWFNKINSYS